MKVLKMIGIGLGALVALTLLLGLVVPRVTEIEKTTLISASKAEIFPHIQYFSKRDVWYPWNQNDPNMEKSIEGEDGTIGATHRWNGNKDVGAGYQTITSITPNERVETDLFFIEPYESEATTYLSLEEAEGGTNVEWGFHTKIPYPFNVIKLFMNVDEASKDFEQGLELLKEAVEEEKKKKYNGYTIQTVDMPYQHYVGFRQKVDFADVASFYTEYFSKIMAGLQQKGIEAAGMPTGIFYFWDDATKTTDMAAAIPVKEKVALDGFSSIELKADKTLAIDYYGPYEGAGKAHEGMDLYLAEKGMETPVPVMEQYITDPTTEPDSGKWLTKVFYPIYNK